MRLLRLGKSDQKKVSDQLEEYYELVKENPEDIRVYLRIAELLIKIRQRDKGIEQYMNAAELYQANNLPQISAAIYKQVLSIDPDQINVYHTLVSLYQQEGFLGDAISIYEQLASYYYKRGRRDDAFDIIGKMTEIDPENIYVKKKVARFYAERNNEPAKKETPAFLSEPWKFSEKKGHSSVKPSSHNLQKQHGYFDLGAALQEEMISEEDTPEDSQAIGDIDDSRVLGVDEVFKEIQNNQAEMEDEDSSLFHFNLGSAFQSMGRFDEAIDEFKKASENPKRHAECCLKMALCCQETEQTNEAVNYLKKGLAGKSLPESEVLALKYELALVYKRSGKVRKARKIFSNIYKTNDGYREVAQELAETGHTPNVFKRLLKVN